MYLDIISKMRKWLILFLCIIGILFLFYRWQAFDDQQFVSTYSKDFTTVSQKVGKSIRFKSENYRYLIFKIEKSESVELIANFEKASSTQNLLKNNKCKKAINGSFISEKGMPIGYFKTRDKIYSSPSKNSLFIGYFLFDGEQFEINRAGPQSDTILGLQSGPLLLEDGKVLPVSLKTDKPARRMIFGISKNNLAYGIAIFSDESELSGPLLDDLASLIYKISDLENIYLKSAINLDGGKHSMFFDGANHIQELVSVGSVFCIK